MLPLVIMYYYNRNLRHSPALREESKAETQVDQWPEAGINAETTEKRCY